jgi:site-specific recombinase XerD
MYAYINGVKKYYSLRCYIKNPKHWKAEKQEVSVLADNWHDINNTIKTILNKANAFVLNANFEGARINIDEFDLLMRGTNHDRNIVVEFIANYLEKFGNRYKLGTIRCYKSEINKLNRYKEKVSFNELTPLFWSGYVSHFISIGNNQNTIEKTFRILKAFIHLAIEHGVINDNPLKKVKVKRIPGGMVNLTIEELSKLENVYKGILTQYQKNVLQCFLFACYTGLRYQDVKELKGVHIIENERIEKNMQKNGRAVIVELSNRAKALLPVIELESASLFRVYANQAMNRELKILAEKAKITKKVSFHVARHTFASITLSLSSDLAAVQQLCGHSRVQTTLIYAKVLEEQKKAAIEKWNTA